MSGNCNRLPVLGDPPLVSAGVQFAIGVDENGEYRKINRRTNSILGQWGENLYLADGSDNAQIILDQLSKDIQTQTLQGLIVRRESGRIMLFVNESADEMIPVLVNGVLTLQNKNLSGIPTTGSGFVIRQPSSDESEFAGTPGIYWVAANGVVTRIDLGTANGQLLKWMDGEPVWSSGAAMAFTGTKGVTGIDDVQAFRQVGDNTRVDIDIPEFVVGDGVDEKTLTNVNINNLDINSGIGLLGTDAALSSNKWYYLYIITSDDGLTVSAVASQSITGPDLSNVAFTTLPYTRWGLASICFWTGTKIVTFIQRGRRFVTERQTFSVDANPGVTTSWSYLTIAKQSGGDRVLTWAVPPIARTMSGVVGGSGNGAAGNVTLSMIVASSFDAGGGIGEQYIGSKRDTVDLTGDGFKRDVGSFIDLLINDPTNGDTMFAWRADSANRFRKCSISGYTI